MPWLENWIQFKLESSSQFISSLNWNPVFPVLELDPVLNWIRFSDRQFSSFKLESSLNWNPVLTGSVSEKLTLPSQRQFPSFKLESSFQLESSFVYSRPQRPVSSLRFPSSQFPVSSSEVGLNWEKLTLRRYCQFSVLKLETGFHWDAHPERQFSSFKLEHSLNWNRFSISSLNWKTGIQFKTGFQF